MTARYATPDLSHARGGSRRSRAKEIDGMTYFKMHIYRQIYIQESEVHAVFVR